MASQSQDESTSIQDIFDAALNLEDTHYKSGYDEGFSDGLLTGKDEARYVGLKSGFETGEELGFYRGCIDVWNSAIKIDPLCFSTRVQKSIKQMDELVSKYPFNDPENELATDVVEGLRLKFKAVCATLNVKLEYDGYPKSSDVGF
ncbi:hypothetical protein DCAR_0312666 [Daucus carota subsp. sativus]|uniref:Uncharacterized protein n=1 Tax=Daucus carota subsp. sativus TaxID=79200 RepID=A0A166B775_DAUCS|nr:PREDICTED: oral cancer-overexpressed protein 1 homolog [Daucus carota subsp. sativus]WOG93382.1 hypothetical protein DCAR_0312666 [Daucus carota subsp. sativus]